MNTFYIICAIVFVVLIICRINPNFSRICPGETYSTKAGQIVRIKHQTRCGAHDIFVATNGVRYHANGKRFGDIDNHDRYRLFRRL